MDTVSKQQVNKLMGSLVEFQDEFLEMPGDDGQWVIQNTKTAIRLFIKAVQKRSRGLQNSTLLSNLGYRIHKATSKPFIARSKFMLNKGAEGYVKIIHINDHFCSLYLNKTEEPQPEKSIFCYRTLKGTNNQAVTQELSGGSSAFITTLQDIWTKLSKQPNGESGDLSVNGKSNTFFVLDVTYMLGEVKVRWFHLTGWYIESFPVDNATQVHINRKIFAGG